jgi:antitoxin (DNA-binding transcriptional repressor) of toxin-antitoxin stability system
MTIQIDIAQVSPALVDDLANNGGEITLTRDGKPVAKLVRVLSDNGPMAGTILYEGDIISPVICESPDPTSNKRVLYKGEWMSAAGAERERSLERLHGSITILGDIVSPIDDVEYDALK